MNLRLVAVACALVLIAAPACGEEEGTDTGTTVTQTVEVEAFDFYFEPTALAVELNAEVTIEFTNNGSVTHSFTAPDLDVEIESGNGEDGTVTFSIPNQPGSYDFFCKYHPDEMAGTISVGGAEEPLEEDVDRDDDEDADVEVDVDKDEDAGEDDGGGLYP